MSDNSIKEFTDLMAWKEAHKLVIGVYKITQSFPDKEKYGLISQLERASISITSNIAEGFGRFGYKDKVRFYYIASGSLSEVKNQLILANELKYIDKSIFDRFFKQANIAHKVLRGLIKQTNKQV